MLTRAIGLPLSPRRGSAASPRASGGRRKRVVGLVVVALVFLLLSSPWAAAGTFPVVQEYVRIGMTTGIAGAQQEDALRETLTEADVPLNVTAAPSAQTVTAGSQVAGAFPSDLAAADGVSIEYGETRPGPASGMANPGTTLPGCTWTACDSGRLSDNVSASSAAGGDLANYSSFPLNVPASSAILSVAVGYKAFDPTGNDHLSMALSWDGGTTWCPAFVTGGLPAADPNAYTFANVTACTGHVWTPADFGPNLTVRFAHVVLGAADTIDLDANVVRVTYQASAYQLDVRYDWSGVPSGAAYGLALAGRISNASVSVEVLTPPSTWASRLTIDTTTSENLSYVLAPSEVASGNASIRFVDALGSGPSDLWVDLAEIVSVQHTYRLDVVENVTGITGADPMLTVEGNISAGGENFDVFAWDFATAAWTTVLTAPFTATNAVHTVALSSDDVSNGTVRLNLRNHDGAAAVPATLTLDAVRVDTTDVAASPPWPLLLGGAAAAALVVGILLYMFVLPRRKRSKSEADEASSEAAEAPASLVTEEADAEVSAEPLSAGLVSPEPILVPPKPEAASAPIPTVDVKALEPGHAYLLADGDPAAALRVLAALTRLGRSGLIVTGRTAAEVEALARTRHTTILVVGRGPEAIFEPLTEANANTIVSAIDAFLRTNPVGVVLLEGLDSLAGPAAGSSVQHVLERTAANVAGGEQLLLASASSGFLGKAEGKHVKGVLESVRVSVPPLRPAAPT